VQQKAMPNATLKERRSHTAETNQRPLAVDATKIESGEIRLRSPLSMLTSKRYLKHLVADLEHQETLSIMGNELQSREVRSRTPERSRSKAEESMALLDKRVDRDHQEDRHKDIFNEQRRARTERERFWDGVRAQLRIGSDPEDDIANSKGCKTQKRQYNPETLPPPQAMPTPSKKWKHGNEFQP